MTRLTALHDGPPPAIDDAAIVSDLRRGHDALTARRRRRTGVASAAALGVVAVGSLSYALGGSGDSRAPQAAASRSAITHTPGSAAPTTTKQGTSTTTSTIQLTAYRGSQLPGYTVRQVPKGYVLQGISGSVLDIAKNGDHSSLDSFDGKLVVMLNDYPGPSTGTPVSVNGHPGRIDDQDGVLILTYSDGTHNVDVQAWSNIHISRDQLVQFAEGVTVLPSAQEGHG
jgi:hypothetical protein